MLITGWLLLTFHKRRILVSENYLCACSSSGSLPACLFVLSVIISESRPASGASCVAAAAATLLCLSLIFGPSFSQPASFFTASFLVDFSVETVFWKAAIPSRNWLGDTKEWEGQGRGSLSLTDRPSLPPFPTFSALPLNSLRSPEWTPSQLFIYICSIGCLEHLVHSPCFSSFLHAPWSNLYFPTQVLLSPVCPSAHSHSNPVPC